MKIYLAHSISTRGEFNDSLRVAKKIKSMGFDVYAAAENASINDKSNNPRPIDIYRGDVRELMTSNIVVVNLSGGLQDGTISEVGFVSGMNEMLEGKNQHEDVRTIVGYTSNARLQQPQFYEGIPSAGANHLVLGMIDKWGVFAGTEDNMYGELRKIKED